MVLTTIESASVVMASFHSLEVRRQSSNDFCVKRGRRKRRRAKKGGNLSILK